MVTSRACKKSAIEFIAVLKQCSKTRDIQLGTKVHAQAVASGFHIDKYVSSALITMYRRCRSMSRARQVFDRMTDKDAVIWNSLILGYVENGECLVALHLFTNMDCERTYVTYLAALSACASLGAERVLERQLFLEKGIAIHEEITARKYDCKLAVANTLVDMYRKCRCMSLARLVFEGMPRKDVVTWTSLILGYVENGESSVALELFITMDCEPNYVTFLAAFKSCIGLASERGRSILEKGMYIHERAKERGFDTNIAVASAVVEMYSKCGSMALAREAFEKMAEKDVVTWTCLILGYVENGESTVALEHFAEMDCEPDHVTYIAVLKACGSGLLDKGMAIHMQARERGFKSNMHLASALVDMYRRCGSMELAWEVFNGMVHKDVVTWNSLIMGHVENGESLRALELYLSMECTPDRVTYLALLKGCASLSALPRGRVIHSTVCKFGLEADATLANALVDLYSKCGCIAAATEVFNCMHSPCIASWNALIAGNASIGDTHMVFSLMKSVEETGLQMDEITYVCILTACSHAGLVDEGKLYFDEMHKRGVSPTVEHYNCFIDMLGRANRFEEAFCIVNTMPFKPSEVTWTSLLEGCRKHKNVVTFDRLRLSDHTY